MNKLLLLLLGACLTQATIRSEDLVNKVFGQGREYVYKYEGEVKSGIPKTSDRFSGMRIECEARLQFISDQEVLMRLEKVKLKTLRGELESPEEKTLNRIIKKTSKETIQQQWHQDAFRQDLFSSEEMDMRSVKTSSEESRETPSLERHQQEKVEKIRKEKEQKTSSEEQARSSRQQSGESSQRSSASVSREESEEVPEQELAELRRQLEKPVRVRYEQGRVLRIQGQKDEPQWSVNIKRGVCNMFQITRNPKNSEMLDKDGREETSNVAFDKSPERLFRIMEEDVSGQCETQYLIRDSQTEKNVQVVTKTKDLQNCRVRPQEQRTIISGKRVGKDQKEEHLQSTVEIRMRVVSDRSRSDKFLIQRAESRGQHVFQPYSEQGGDVITFAKQILELVEAKTTISEPKIPEPRQPEEKGNLIFVFEKKVPQTGSSQESRESREQSKEGTEQKVTELCEGISRGLKETIAEDTPRKFLQLVTELRKMSAQQLKKFCEEKIPKIEEGKEEPETRKLMIDAVSTIGTEEALKVVWELLQENKITEGDAQSLVGGLSQSINPCTATGTRIMLEIAKSPQALQSPNLRKVAWLAFGTMVHTFIKTQPQETAEVIQLKREYAKQLLSGVQQDKPAEEKMMCLKAIGNAGLEDSVDRLVEIISGKDAKTTPTELRLQAIYALRRIAKKQPHKTRNILFPVFKNPENPVEERIASFIGMMDSEPQASFLELVAQSTQRETSNQVGRFVYTHLKSCAESRMGRDQKMRVACQRALRLCRPFNLGIQYSQSENFQAVDDEMKMGASVAIQTISDKRSVLPHAATAKLSVQALGYNINFLETGVRASGLQTMADSLYRQWEGGKGVMHYLKKKSQETSREYRDSASREYRDSARDSSSIERQRTLRNIEAEKIQSKLNIKTRTPEDPKGQIYLKMAGNEVYFHQFRSDLLKKFVREDRLSIQDIEQQLKEGVQTTMTKALLVADATQRIPTSLGLPLNLDIQAVLLTRSKIGGRMEVSPRLFQEDRPTEQKDISAIDARLESTHTVAMQTIGKMTVDCRVIKSGVGLDVTMNSFIPISGKVTLDLKNSQHKLTFETPEKERELLVLKSRPIVFTEETAVRKTRDAKQVKETQRKEITLQGKKIQKFPSQMKAAYGKQALGLEFALKSSMISRLNKEKRAPFQPLTGPVELRLAVRPGQNRPEKVEIECRPQAARYTSSEERSSEMSSKEQATSRRLELDIRANHPKQERTMRIKVQTKDEQVEEDPRRRTLDSRERKVPRKFLARSLREKEPEVSSETQYQARQDGKQQTRKTIAIQIERSRIPQLESWDTKACVDMQLEYPTNRDIRLIQDGVMKAMVDAKWGADCSGRGPRVQLNAKFQKSVQQRREERREESAEWESRSGEEGLTLSQEQSLDSILDSVKSLWTWPKSKSAERKPRSTEWEQPSSSQEASREWNSKETSRSWETSWESSEWFQKNKLRRNLYRQCLRDRRDGQQYSRPCQEAVRQRSQLRELDAEIMFQNIPEWLQETCLSAHRYIQNTFYGRSSIRQVGVANPAGVIRVRASLDRPEREMNVTIRTPRQEHNISRLPLDWVPLFFPSTRRTITEQAMDKVTKNKYTPYCKVQANDKIRTFDDVEYKYRIGKCDHILAKDASPEEKFMVLVHKPEVDRPEKTVKVFLESLKIELRVPRGTSSQEAPQSRQTSSQERLRSKENIREESQDWRQSQEHQQSREAIRQEPTSRRDSQEQRTSQQTSSESQSKGSQSRTSKSVEWTSSEEKMHQHIPIEVTIDGREVQVQPGKVRQIRHQTTGKVICNIRRHGNKIELSSPKNGLKVKVDGHYVEVKVSHDYRKKIVGLCGNFDGEQSNEYEGPREEIYRSPKEFALSYLVPSKQCEEEGKKQPVMRNIMITRLNEKNEEQACFSKTPVAQCPEGSRKTKSEVRSTEFHCLPKELQSTQHMIKLHKTKPLADKLQGKSTDLVQDVEAELECRE